MLALALPLFLIYEETYSVVAAYRAHNTLRPASLSKVKKAVVRVGEALNRFL